ncbi:uncharacterized protein LOC108038308 [Drosophila rhopaloa]|uniref:Uncharacterized protein LOC108038308 n=1 Tax=Drosophila rhopaloa TaxID=1041015 RepID=A0A6P4EB61_DRORH|nr:uncharacterized protein LOC108038308 [Drosophila rhopaloa]
MDEELCRLCKAIRGQFVPEKPKIKSANKLLHRLFDCYKIDIAILGKSSCICESCFELVLRISESLEKWSKAQEEIQDKPLEIDDSQVFQVKLEAPSSEDEEELARKDYVEEPEWENDDLSDQNEVKLELQSVGNGEEAESAGKYDQNDVMELTAEELLDPSDREFFSVGLSRDGLAMTKFFKDKTKAARMMCTCCDNVLENLAHIRMHSGIARPNPAYYCRECASDFFTIRELQTHIETMGHFKSKCGGRDLEFLCLKCNEIFPRFFDVIRHENIAHSSPTFKRQLRGHNFISVTDNPKAYGCSYEYCNRKFRVYTRYLQHLQWHRDRFHPCPHAGCNTAIKGKNYSTHMRSHLREGQFMTLDPKQRVEPDGRKVPYGKRQLRAVAVRVSPDVLHPLFSNGGQFISLPKELTLQHGKYIDVRDQSSKKISSK